MPDENSPTTIESCLNSSTQGNIISFSRSASADGKLLRYYRVCLGPKRIVMYRQRPLPEVDPNPPDAVDWKPYTEWKMLKLKLAEGLDMLEKEIKEVAGSTWDDSVISQQVIALCLRDIAATLKRIEADMKVKP